MGPGWLLAYRLTLDGACLVTYPKVGRRGLPVESSLRSSVTGPMDGRHVGSHDAQIWSVGISS